MKLISAKLLLMLMIVFSPADSRATDVCTSGTQCMISGLIITTTAALGLVAASCCSSDHGDYTKKDDDFQPEKNAPTQANGNLYQRLAIRGAWAGVAMIYVGILNNIIAGCK